MNQNKQAPRRRMTRREWRIRRCLRLARNWAVFLAACGAAVALMTSGILWLLPKAHALIAGPEAFVARNYDGTEYQLNLADVRLVLVNGLPRPLRRRMMPRASSWKRKPQSSTAPWRRLRRQTASRWNW